jgi:tRNA nucleotidyltransferase/poly(A) polymerase
MNSCAVDLITGEVIDPFCGRRAMDYRVIVAVGMPTARFTEDALRMIRAIRLVSKLPGFTIDSVTFDGIRDNADLIKTVAAERILEELLKLLQYNNPEGVYAALIYLQDSGLMERIIPEFKASFGFKQNNDFHHLPVNLHVYEAVKYSVSRGFSPLVRLAVLLHDIAKPVTYQERNGRGTFYSHDDKGDTMSRVILERLKAPNDMIDSVALIIKEHQRPSDENCTDKALRRYVAVMGSLVGAALDARESDIGGHSPEVAAHARSSVDVLRKRIAELPNHITGFTPAKLALRGDQIATIFGVSGASIGILKKAASAAVIDGLVENEEVALIEFLKKSEKETSLPT